MDTPTPSPRVPADVSPEPDRPPEPNANHVKLLLVDFRSGEAVEHHPALVPWLSDGWQVRSAVPRVVEKGQTRLLVVMEREGRPVERKRTPTR